jgi:hypothetical protein
MLYRYTGGVRQVAVVLPTRTLEVSAGELVERRRARGRQARRSP